MNAWGLPLCPIALNVRATPGLQFPGRRPLAARSFPVHAGRPALAPFLLLKPTASTGCRIPGRFRNPGESRRTPPVRMTRDQEGSRMHDPAYKLLFARPRMVRDLLDGFAARGWSGALDFDTLAPLPASFVSEDLQQRHGDLVWRIRFRDDRWLYLVLLLEFQATVDPAMALRMLTYTALLYQRLDADGVLRDHGALPPVLPVVLYNGRRPWTAPVEMTDLVAVGRDLLAPYQPSQRYYLLDGARVADADLPADNLVSALLALEKTRDAARLREVLRALSDLLRAQGDDHLTQAFVTWLHQGLRFAGPLPSGEGDPLTQFQETQTMLEENVREWTRELLEQGRAQGIEQGIEQGRAQGIEQGRHEERALLCRLAARKFDAGAAEGLAAALAGVADPDRLARVGDWIIECATASELLARVRGDNGSGG